MTPEMRLKAIISLGDIPPFPPYPRGGESPWPADESKTYHEARTVFVRGFDSWCKKMLDLLSFHNALYVKFDKLFAEANRVQTGTIKNAVSEIDEMKRIKQTAIKDLEAKIAEKKADNEETERLLDQAEKHHSETLEQAKASHTAELREYKSSNTINKWMTAVSFIGAIAAWASVWYSHVQTDAALESLKLQVSQLQSQTGEHDSQTQQPPLSKPWPRGLIPTSSTPIPEIPANTTPATPKPEAEKEE